RQYVAVKPRAIEGKMFFADEVIEVAAQLLRGILPHFGANSDRQMVSSREGPKVALKLLQEFHFDDVFFDGNEIAQGHLQITGTESGCFWEQTVTRTCREHDKIRNALFAGGGNPHLRRVRIDFRDPRADRGTSGGDGAGEEKAIENFARVNHDRVTHLEARAMAAAGNQFGGPN